MTPTPTRPLKCPSPQTYSLGHPSSASPEVGTRVSSADPLPTRNPLEPRWALQAWGGVGVDKKPGAVAVSRGLVTQSHTGDGPVFLVLEV